MFLGFQAFGHHLPAQGLGGLDDLADDDLVFLIVDDVSNETLVDLDYIGSEPFQIGVT